MTRTIAQMAEFMDKLMEKSAEHDKKFDEQGKRLDMINATLDKLTIQSIEDRKRAEEDRKRAEEDRQKAERHFKRAEEDRKRAEEDRKRAEEDRLFQQQKFATLYENLGWTGKFAEELYYRGVKRAIELYGYDLPFIERNVKPTHSNNEYDIVLKGENDAGEKTVILFEIKATMKHDDVKKMVEKQISSFLNDFPEYTDYVVYGGVGGLVMPDDVEKYAIKQGLMVFRTSSEMIAPSPKKIKFKNYAKKK